MGLPNSKDNNDTIAEEYQIIERKTGPSTDSRFGDVLIAKSNKTGQLVYIKESDMHNEEKEDLERYTSNLVPSLKDYYRIFITQDYKIANTQTQFGYCTQATWKISIIMAYFEKTLELEIEQRALPDMRQKFPEDEIWMMIEAIIEMEQHYKKFNRMHGDIRTSNIFITEDGAIKFLDAYLVSWRYNGFMRAILDHAKVPLAPEKMASLKKDIPSEEATQENEIWTVGIVVLCMATLKKDNTFYDWTKKDIIRSNIDKALEELRKTYSQKLFAFVSTSLHQTPSLRFSMAEFLTMNTLSGSYVNPQR